MSPSSSEPDRTPRPAAAGPAAWLGHLAPARSLSAVLLIYVCLRGFILGGMSPVWFSDTAEYVLQYREGFIHGFFGRSRPWAYPLFLWLTGYHYGLAIVVQRIAGALAWFALARAAAGLFQGAAARRFVFYALLVLSLTLFAIQWDVMLLCESLTLACFLLLGAAWFRLLREAGPGLRPLAAMALLALPLAGLRDANIPLLLVFALAAAARTGLVYFRERAAGRRGGSRRWLAALALCALPAGVALLHQGDVMLSRRGWGNIGNVLSQRCFEKDLSPDFSVTDKANLEWMARRFGLPARDAEARIGRTVTQAPPIGPEYQAWLKTTGAKAWTSFLLHHPGWFFAHYSRYNQYWVSVSEYAQVEPEKWRAAHLGLAQLIHSALYASLGFLFSLQPLNLLLLPLAAGMGALWLSSFFRPPLRRFSAPLGALSWTGAVAALAPLVAYLGDSVEGWRHALLGLAALYISLPLGLALLVEMAGHALARRKSKRTAAAHKAHAPAPHKRKAAPAGRGR